MPKKLDFYDVLDYSDSVLGPYIFTQSIIHNAFNCRYTSP